MKNYKIIEKETGLEVGVIELYPDEVKNVENSGFIVETIR